MNEYLGIFLTCLVGITAHHEVHLVPAHKICPNVSSEADILLPDPHDCSIYYRCENGKAVPQSCPPGLAWCQILLNCTLPALANCTLGHTIVTYSPEELATYNPNTTGRPGTTGTPGPEPGEENCPEENAVNPDPDHCDNYFKCKHGKPEKKECEKHELFSAWLGICTPKGVANCIGEGSQENKTCPVNGAKRVYPTDCNKYYECVNNNVEIKECPDHLEFNKWYKGCYTHDKSHCRTYTTVSPTTNPTTVTSNPDEICPIQGATLPNPLDCQTFYRCDGKEPTIEHCPKGFYYSCWDQECLPPSDGSCIPTEGQKCKKSKDKLPNPQDCGSYYECKEGVTKEKKCEHNKEFNAWTEKCVDPKYAHCKKETPTTSTALPTPSTTPKLSETNDICPVDGAKLPNPLDCHSYYICKGENPVEQKCPNELEYSCWDQECLPAESADCITNQNQTGQSCKNNNTTMPNVEDCSSYYTCVDGKVKLEHCKDDLEFNAWYGKCVNSSVSHCKSTTTQTSIGTTKSSTETASPNTGPPSILCPKGSEGLKYPSYKDCSGYQECDNNRHLQQVKCDPPEYNYNCESKKCENITHCCAPGNQTTQPTEGTSSEKSTDHATGSTGSGPTGTDNPSSSEGTTHPGTGSTDHSTGSTGSGPTGTDNPSSSEGTTQPGTGSTDHSTGSTGSGPTGTDNPSSSEGNTHPGTGSTDHSTGSTGSGPTGTDNPSSSEETTQPGTGSTDHSTGSTGSGPTGTDNPSSSEGNTHPGTGSTDHSTGSTGSGPTGTDNPSSSEGTTHPGTGSTDHSTGSTGSGPTGTDNPSSSEGTTHPGTGSTDHSTGSTGSGPTGTDNPSSSEGTTQPGTGSTDHSTGSTGSEPTGTDNPSSSEGNTHPGTGSTDHSTGSTGSGPTGTDNPSSSEGTTHPGTGSTDHSTGSTGSGPTGTDNPSSSEGTTQPGTGSTDHSTGSTGSEPTGTDNPSSSEGNTHPGTGSTDHSTGSTGSGPTGTDNPSSSEGTTHPGTGSTDHSTGSTGSGPTGTDNPSSSEGTTQPGTGSTDHSTGSTGSGPTGTDNPSSSEGNTHPGTGSTDHSTGSTGSGPTGTDNPSSSEGTTHPGTGSTDHSTGSTGSGPTGTDNPSSSEGTTQPGTSTTKGKPSILCPQPDLIYPSYSDCSAYMKCDSNRQLKTIKCDPPTFNYNCETNKCENITHCCAPGANTTTTSTDTTSTTTISPTPSPHSDVCPFDGAKLPNPVECTSFYVCRNHSAVSVQCPPGQEYSCWDQTCEDPKDATCIKDGIKSDQACNNTEAKMPNLADCSSYYQCVNGKVKQVYCDSEFFYSHWFEKCVEPSLSHCQTYPTNPPPTVTGWPTPTSTPEVTPGTDNICPFEGALLPNPLNCSTYYSCIKEEPVLKSCPSGEAYSCWDQKCESSAVAQCVISTSPGKSCSIDSLLIPNIVDCGSYYQCQNGTIVTKNCPHGNEYNSWFKECVKPNVSHCVPSTTPTTPTTPTSPVTTISPKEGSDVCPEDGAKIPDQIDCTAYYVCVNNTPVPQKCPNGQEYSCWDQKCEKAEKSTCIKEDYQGGNNCSKNGDRQQNVADCSSYYLCVNNKVQLKYCPRATFFSKWFKKCLQFKESHCKTSPPIIPPVTNEPPPTTLAPSTSDDICPYDGATLPNPLNCTQYFLCLNHEIVPQDCPKDQGYSCWNQQCEKDALDQCVPNGGSGQDCSVEGLVLADIDNCHSYYECHNGKIISKTCHGKEEFNQWFLKCVSPERSHCHYSTGTPQPSTTTSITPLPVGKCLLGDDGAKLPNPNNCNGYFTCQNGIIVSKNCPAGQIYSCWDQKCERPSKGVCINQANQQGQHCSKPDYKLSNIADCSSYYSCIGGKVEIEACAKGHIYDEWLHACVSSDVEVCKTYTTVPSVTPPSVTDPTTPSETYNVCPLEGALLPNPLQCSTYYKCINGTPTLENCPGGEEYSCWDQRCEPDTDATCVTQGAQNGDNCTVDGLKVPDVKQCNRYYECVNGTIISQHCPPGEEFNSNFQGCYKPALAHCQPGTASPPNPPTSSSPTPGPTPNDTCPVDGALLPNPLDCNAYYKCINGNPEPQKCADGYEYSCWDQKCEPAGEAQCISEETTNSTKCQNNGQRIQNPANCHTYYECVNKKVTLKHCLFNWFYNKWFHICVPFEIIAHCEKPGPPPTKPPTEKPTGPPSMKDDCPVDGALLPNPLDCNAYYKCENHNPTPQKCPSGQEYSCWDQKCKQASDAQCINQGVQLGKNCSRDGVKLQDIANCYSYYECVNGKVEKSYCFLLTQYNKWYHKCTPAQFAHCKTDPIVTPKPITPLPSTPSPTYDICPLEGALLPNPIDCTKYYKCINGTPQIQSCPEGLEYSCWDQKCEPDTNADCINVGSQLNKKCTVDGLKLHNIEDCSSYYECHKGKAELKHCPHDKEFNDRFQDCYPHDQAHCQTYPTIATSTGTPKPSPSLPSNNSDICPTEGALLPNPLNCSAYYKCVNGTPEPRLCADGYEYSCWDLKCEPADQAKCITEGINDGDPCQKNGQKNPDPSDCHKYFECSKNKVIRKTCLLNWWYNKWFKFCVPLKELAYCNTTSPPPPTPSTTSTTTLKPIGTKDICPRNGVIIPNPSDCSSYLKCENHVPTDHKCPSGQKFSAWDQQCKNASLAQCVNSGSPEGQSCSRDGVRIQNLQSCTSYYDCVDGKVQKCGCFIGFQYNRWYQECELNLFSHCNTYPTVAPPATTVTTTPTPAVTEPHVGQPTVYPLAFCSKNKESVPDVKDCTRYYYCNKKITELYSCPPGQSFDSWSEQCVDSAHARCVKDSDSWVGQDCPKNQRSVPDPNSCRNYFVCEKKKIHSKSCGIFSRYDVWHGKCHVFGRCASNIV